ncbi:MAG: C45 family peptidase [Pseudomonadales bacterium]
MKKYDFYYEFSGTHYELGLAHGKALAPLIHSAIAKWKVFLSEGTGMSFEDLLSRFLRDTDYRSAIEKWTPHLLDELRGISVGADIDEELIYAWQLVDEVIDYVVEYIYIEKCSTVGGYDQGVERAKVLGKTQDLPHCYIGAAVLLRTHNTETGRDIMNSTVAGIITQDGMSRNLGVCLNHIGQLDRSAEGLPVTFIARLLMEQCDSVDAARVMLGSINHASGMNYGLIDKKEVRTFEVSSNDIAEFLPAPNLKRIWHTNHPLANTNYCRAITMWNGLPDIEAGNTVTRMNYLDREMAVADKPITVARAQELLSSREAPISSQAEDEFPTVNSMVMEFTDVPKLYFAPGPPSQVDYVGFTFD